MTIEFGAMHCGYFEIDLCTSAHESPYCFQHLEIVGGTEKIRPDNKMCVPFFGGESRSITATVRLPPNVTCDRCTLRWTYRTNYQCFPNFQGKLSGKDENTRR